MVRTPASQAGNAGSNPARGTEPDQSTVQCKLAPVAQVVEQGPLKPKVAGSSPAGGKKNKSKFLISNF
jgi:hypothetical protein